jgi:tetratricopeptide (TPR) repeat protein
MNRARARIGLALGLALDVWTSPGSEAHAEPSRWLRARDARLADEVRATNEAERALVDARRSGRSSSDALVPSELSAARALDALRGVGGARARTMRARWLTARALQELGRPTEAIEALEGLATAPRVPTTLRSDALGDLAIAYARADRVEEEIAAYEAAIALEPHAVSRATMLANQAEAFMVAGDVARAVLGYRASLGELTSRELPSVGPTTHWSLGVALDRTGDLDGALAEIARARAYDPLDLHLRSPGWFFVPPYDEHWYEALGHWLVGRRADELERRRDAYERAERAWVAYLASAPPDGAYVPIARGRLATLRAERTRLESEATGRSTRQPLRLPRNPAP